MQNLSTVARFVVAAAEGGSCAGEFGAGEFCAASVTAEKKTAPASAMLIDARVRVRIYRSLPRANRADKARRLHPVSTFFQQISTDFLVRSNRSPPRSRAIL